MSIKIGILSDTHDLLRPEVIEVLQGCDTILHAGDISSQRILDQLEQIAPVKVVRGNNDKEWAEVFADYCYPYMWPDSTVTMYNFFTKEEMDYRFD